MVVIIVLAFLGGVALNGPALRYAQTCMFESLGLKEGPEIASIDTPPQVGASVNHQSLGSQKGETGGREPALGEQKSEKPAEPLPRQPRPTAEGGRLSEFGSAGKSQTKSRVERGPTANQDTEFPSLRRHDLSSAEPQTVGPSLPAMRVQERSNTNAGGDLRDAAPAPLDPSIGTALLSSLASNRSVDGERMGANSIALEATPASGKAGPPLPMASRAQVGTKAPSQSTEAYTAWTRIRQKLRTLGVTRYTFEGNPNGHVSFRCVIPLAGRQAVSEQFEGEGDDELQAVQIAIRRISLWQAAGARTISTDPH
jgi:hypothetical protein